MSGEMEPVHHLHIQRMYSRLFKSTTSTTWLVLPRKNHVGDWFLFELTNIKPRENGRLLFYLHDVWSLVVGILFRQHRHRGWIMSLAAVSGLRLLSMEDSEI